MRSSLVRSIQIISRSALPPKTQFLAKAIAEKAQPTVIDILTSKKATSEGFPANLRIEPVVKKEDLKNVNASIRPRLKKLLKEA
ncbi:hypothetical protein BT96DRAFT_913596 [Gymnopus androsaceus JB14]|uniref:Uncharacterized protein n=1 Tax=Gymnopus androsaceus JB14 TaxID=1447944 RepID=A0A6A4IK47_9AGAR|nr:hypothetical protein BT96DRAFT_913596 [Gymnopus androsaceus JB14]